MAHFARVEDGVVVQVVAVKNCAIGGCVGPLDPDYVAADHLNCGSLDYPASEPLGQTFLTGLFGGEWVQTSYSAKFRGQYAGIGMTFDATTGNFLEPDQTPAI